MLYHNTCNFERKIKMESNSDNYLENIVSLSPIQSGHKDFLLKLFCKMKYMP